jgi:hypothetical protein
LVARLLQTSYEPLLVYLSGVHLKEHQRPYRVRGSYYDVLGVSPTADEAEIKARYLALMRRHHPDVNHSPMAHARASQIGEAFRVLSDATLRSRHDAELAQQRQEAVSARAIILYRGRKSRRATGKSGRRLLGRSGARVALGALLVGTVLVGWQLDRHVNTGVGTAAAPVTAPTLAATANGTDGDAHETIAFLNAESSREAMAMPPVSRDAVSAGAAAFRRLAAAGDPAQARAYSEQCHAGAAGTGTWEALDFCVAFDQAVFLADGKKPSALSGDYFVDRHDRAAHLYVDKVSSMDAIATRLDLIRRQVAPPRDDRLQARTARVLNRIAKKGWRLADAAREVFDPSRPEQIESVVRPRGF